tara:strand:+ start:37654 stop:39045 length:1392 start_codon:yes stop_codon:yes gene_type:complete
MPIYFYNTLTRNKEIFKPIRDGKVGIYTCGPTVYDYAHIGNFRTFIFEDLLKRFLLHRGYKVNHIMNITDIDDKTIKRSRNDKVALALITEQFTRAFFDDSNWLKIMPADKYPRATNYIHQMIEMIQILIENKNAYITNDGSVYFNIQSFSDYGQLIDLDIKSNRSTNRISNDEYAKDDPQDFALWKAWKEEDGDISWDAPWGRGRPGWHIECSVMSNKCLSEHFDIHCGGVDNIFPHHENEIAQSKCATGNKFVNIWMHSEHLIVEAQKMSKSLNNYYKIKDLIDLGYSPENVRYQLLSGHYRTRIVFSSNKKIEGDRVINRISEFRARLIELGARSLKSNQFPEEYNLFIGKLNDDLDSPGALSVFFKWMRNQNSRIDRSLFDDSEIGKAWAFLNIFDFIFGIVKKEADNIPIDIDKLSKEREIARKKGNWKKADEIRDILRARGWMIEDLISGYKLKKLK